MRLVFRTSISPLSVTGKKRKAKDGKKGGKKKKKRKTADSDLSEQEFEAASEDFDDYTPKPRSKRSKRDSPPPSTATSASATPTGAGSGAAVPDEKPTVSDVCDNFGLTDVDLDYTEADYQNLTTYKLFQSTYKQRIQAVNPKVRWHRTQRLILVRCSGPC